MKKLSMQCSHFARAFLLLALALVVPFCAAAQQPASAQSNPTLKAAICPIVYPSDETPGNKGVRYTFFGNAFFINSQGYLVTAAHVLETFRDLGQPYILVDRPNSPRNSSKPTSLPQTGLTTSQFSALFRIPSPQGFASPSFRSLQSVLPSAIPSSPARFIRPTFAPPPRTSCLCRTGLRLKFSALCRPVKKKIYPKPTSSFSVTKCKKARAVRPSSSPTPMKLSVSSTAAGFVPALSLCPPQTALVPFPMPAHSAPLFPSTISSPSSKKIPSPGQQLPQPVSLHELHNPKRLNRIEDSRARPLPPQRVVRISQRTNSQR